MQQYNRIHHQIHIQGEKINIDSYVRMYMTTYVCDNHEFKISLFGLATYVHVLCVISLELRTTLTILPTYVATGATLFMLLGAMVVFVCMQLHNNNFNCKTAIKLVHT